MANQKNKVKIEKIDKYFISKLEDTNFFKMDCGLQSCTLEESYANGLIAFIAGFSAIDVIGSSEIIDITSTAINEAKLILKNYSIPVSVSPLIFVSEKLSTLKRDLLGLEKKFFNLNKKNFDVFEIHLDQDDKQLFRNVLLLVKKHLYEKEISINVSREILSNASVIEIIKLVNSEFKNNFMVEVDGKNTTNNIYNCYNDTIQTISIADIINKELKWKEISFSKIPLLLSGGINSETRWFAEQCGVKFNGITLKKNQLLALKDINIDNIESSINLNVISKVLENF